MHVCNLDTQEAKAGLLQVRVYLSNNVRLLEGKRDRETTPGATAAGKVHCKSRAAARVIVCLQGVVNDNGARAQEYNVVCLDQKYPPWKYSELCIIHEKHKQFQMLFFEQLCPQVLCVGLRVTG